MAERSRLSLAVLFVAAVVPLALFAAVVVAEFAQQQRSFMEKELQGITQSLSLAVDHEIALRTATLGMLASSPSLRTGDLRAFHDMASHMLVDPAGAGVAILLADAQTGENLLDTRRPYGQPLPPAQFSDTFRKVVNSRQAAVSNVAPSGELGDEPMVLFRAPVLQGNNVPYVLTLAVLPLPIERYVVGQAVSPDWTIAVLDPDGVVAARSRASARFIGQRISDDTLAAMKDRRIGLRRVRTLEGTESYGMLYRSPTTGWWVAMAVPRAAVDGPLHRSLAAMAGSGLLLLTLVIGLIVLRSRAMARSEAAEALHRARHEELDAQKIAALEAAREQAEAAIASKNGFLANMSHELRTPLNAIIGFSDAMLGHGFADGCPPRCLDYLGGINQSGRHLLEIINDILDMSEVESGTMALERQPVAVAEAIAACVRLAAEGAARGNIGLSLQLSENLPRLLADPIRLRQVILNLLSNAVKFTPEGGQVRIRARTGADGLLIEIEDTGIGMDADGLRIALAPFGQVEGHMVRRWEGTGLGLPLAARLTELQGGRLELSSQRGGGTTARLIFPPDRLQFAVSAAPSIGMAAAPSD